MRVDLNDLISRKRIRFELGESTMPKRYKVFCLKVIDSKKLTPIVEIEQFIPKKVKEYTGRYNGKAFHVCKCPVCGCNLDGNQVQKYCHECGQRLEWEE